MICKPCRKAGKVNFAACLMPGDSVLRDQARELHAQCQGGCDCQHRVGQGINRGQPK